MFSGIVEMIGVIKNITHLNDCCHFTIKCTGNLLEDVAIGDSIAVNGVCLTVTEISSHSFNVTAVPETLRVTNLGQLKIGNLVNLERSLKYNGRIGGHMVQGHVDSVGHILDIQPQGKEAILVKIGIAGHLAKYMVTKGYITLDGMSITIVEADKEWFTVTFIPHTQAMTIVRHYKIGQGVNIEVDILGKYIEKIMGSMQHA